MTNSISKRIAMGALYCLIAAPTIVIPTGVIQYQNQLRQERFDEALTNSWNNNPLRLLCTSKQEEEKLYGTVKANVESLFN